MQCWRSKLKPQVFVQKSPISLQTTPMSLQKNPGMHEDEDCMVRHFGMHDDQLWWDNACACKRAMCLYKRALCYRKKALHHHKSPLSRQTSPTSPPKSPVYLQKSPVSPLPENVHWREVWWRDVQCCDNECDLHVHASPCYYSRTCYLGQQVQWYGKLLYLSPPKICWYIYTYTHTCVVCVNPYFLDNSMILYYVCARVLVDSHKKKPHFTAKEPYCVHCRGELR